MKKLLAILMALALVLVNVAALAADPAADPVEPNTPAAQDDGYYHKGTEYDLAATESQSIKIFLQGNLHYLFRGVFSVAKS